MIDVLLIELEQTMKTNGLWSETAPKADAFMSTAPFCYDSMSFENWLQYVFIVRIKQLIAAKQALPTGANITPMAEQVFAEYDDVIAVIKKIDKALC